MSRRARRIHHKERILKNRFSLIKNKVFLNGVYQVDTVSEPHYKYGVHINSSSSYSQVSYFEQSNIHAPYFADGTKPFFGNTTRWFYLPRKRNWAKPSNLLSKRKNRKYPYKDYETKQKIKYEKEDLSFKEQLEDLDWL